MRLLPTLILVLIISGCTATNNALVPVVTLIDVEKIVNNYFDTYAERTDFQKLMSFYAQDAVLEDMIYGNFLQNKQQIAQFFDWENGKFNLPENMPALVVQNQVVQNNTVVTEGYFNAFSYNEQPLGPWRFVIWLEFDNEGLIKRQVDWINYTPRKD